MALISLAASLLAPVSLAALGLGVLLGFKHHRSEIRALCIGSCVLIVIMVITTPVPSV